MSTSYDEAVATLYRASVDVFVAERKRLAAELKTAGDKAGAARLAKLGRPTVAAWTVNQLWWQARDLFDELLASGQRLRGGDLAATQAHREAMAKLRARAVTLLGASPHAATESTLRRVMNSLSALGASGSFEPDPPGALAEDRNPPGFDLAGMEFSEAGPPAESRPAQLDKRRPELEEHSPPPKERAAQGREARERERRELEEQRRKQEAERRELEEQRRRAEQERAQKEAQRRQLEGALHRAKQERDSRKRQVDRLKSDVAEAEQMHSQAEAQVSDIMTRLAAL